MSRTSESHAWETTASGSEGKFLLCGILPWNTTVPLLLHIKNAFVDLD